MSSRIVSFAAALLLLCWGTVAAAGQPSATTLSGEFVSSSQAKLNGSVFPNAESTNYWFRAYPGDFPCDDAHGNKSAVGTASGTQSVAVYANLTGAVPGTRYYYCLIAQNNSGTAYGSVNSYLFADPNSAPIVSTSAANNLTLTGATLRGSVNPGNQATTAWFRYSSTQISSCNDTFGTRIPLSGGQDMGSGSSSGTATQSLTGLTPGTTYYACVIARNSYGTSLGSIVPFTTVATPPTASTQAASDVTANTVTLNGSATPNGTGTTGFFRYDFTDPGTSCGTAWGTRAPASGGSALGQGDSAVSFQLGVQGLVGGTLYYYCAFATNPGGTVSGTVQTFTTPTAAPLVTTVAATNVADVSITLNATTSTNGADTTVWFRYDTTSPAACDDTFGTRLPDSAGTVVPTGPVPVNIALPLTSLTPATTYYYCALAQSSLGTVYGSVRSIRTLAAPVVTTDIATGLTTVAAILNGSAVPQGAATTGYFVYSLLDPGTCSANFGASTTPVQLGSGLASVPFSATLTSLPPNTKYFYCAIANNAFGTDFGAVRSFTTVALAPTATTNVATNVAGTTVTISGTANAQGVESFVVVRYSTTNPGTCNDTFGQTFPVNGVNIGSATTAVPVSIDVTGLAYNTTYYFCIVATNSGGSGRGALYSFKTYQLPTVVMDGYSLNGSTAAVMYGKVTPHGSPTTAWYHVYPTDPGACDPATGDLVPPDGVSVPFDPTYDVERGVNRSVQGLTPMTDYYACLVATNLAGTVVSPVIHMFTSLPPEVETLEATDITQTSLTLNGLVNPNGHSAEVSFVYDTQPGHCGSDVQTYLPYLPAGFDTVSVSLHVTGLTPGQTYYFCVYATGNGSTLGSIVSAKLLPDVPTINTLSATNLALGTATIRGYVNPHGSDTQAWLRWDTTNPGTCNDTFGTRIPAGAPEDIGDGGDYVIVPEVLTDLPPATVIYYCALASSAYGTVMGPVVSFTSPGAPAQVSLTVGTITAASMVLTGSVVPLGLATTAWTRYDSVKPDQCNDDFGTMLPTHALGNAFTARTYSDTVTGLTGGQTYYACVIAQNTLGISFSDVVTITLPVVPFVETLDVSNIGRTRATVTGQVTSTSLTTTAASFRYSTTARMDCVANYGTAVTASFPTHPAPGDPPVSFQYDLTLLSEGTTYYYCAGATSPAGTGYGVVRSFTTLKRPTVTTVAPSAMTSTTATLEGIVNPNGLATTASFVWMTSSATACSSANATPLPATGGFDLGSGTSPVSYNILLTGLTASTKYYFCALAQNSAGQIIGTQLSFTTPAPPTVTTGSASASTPTVATLNGSGNPRGGDATASFRLGTANGTCSDSFGTQSLDAGGIGAGTANVNFSASVSGLTANATYYYCAIVVSTFGKVYGSVASFITPGPPTATTKAAVPLQSSATLNGSGNPGGTDTTGYFRWSTTTASTCDDSFGSRWPNTGGSAMGTGNAVTNFSQVLNGLASGTDYYFCAITTNQYGTAYGAVTLLHTTTLPTVTTLAATSIGTTATLQGTGNPQGAATTGYFRLGTTQTDCASLPTRVPTTNGATLGSGLSDVAFSNATATLTAGSTYYFCAAATNTVGTVYGAVLSFIAPQPPLVTPVAATALTGSGATLNGSVTPRTAETTVWARYSTTSPGASCNDTFGTRLPATGGTVLPAGSAAVAVGLPATGLTSGSTYYFCVIAQNAGGKTMGTPLNFTEPWLPTVSMSATTLLRSRSVTLNASVQPHGTATTVWFRYGTESISSCTDDFGTRIPETGGTSLSGTSTSNLNQPLTGLSPGTAYYGCVFGQNATGLVSSGAPFSTTSEPIVTTLATTDITPTGGTLNATVNANGLATQVWFRYATTAPSSCNDTFGTRFPATGGVDAGSALADASVQQIVTGLTAATTYFYCAIAQNSGGSAFGQVLSFTAGTPPGVQTLAAASVSGHSADLRGSATPFGATTTGWLRYDKTDPGTCNDTFGTRLPATNGANVGNGMAAVPFDYIALNLDSTTTYYYCALARSVVGTAYGTVMTFTTPAGTPVVTTGAADTITSRAANINASADPGGSDTIGWFRYDTQSRSICDDSFGTRAPVSGGISLGSTAVTPFSIGLTALAPGVTYYYCALAQNPNGTANGTVRTFVTAAEAPTVTTLDATNLSTNSATLNASVQANGADAQAWFRIYSDLPPTSCTNTGGQRFPSSGGLSATAGAVRNLSYPLTNFTAGTTYYFCAFASNSAGTSAGAVKSIQPLSAPVVTTLSVQQVSPGLMRLRGQANPQGRPTTAWFRWSATYPGSCNDTFGTLLPTTLHNLGSGNSPQSYTDDVLLTPEQTYYYCAIAQNDVGFAFGTLQTFTVEGTPPLVTTSDATMITESSAVLRGSATPQGLATTAWFRYDTTAPTRCDDAFGTKVSMTGFAVGSGLAARTFAANLADLTPGVTYSFCAIAESDAGKTFGALRTFKTEPGMPSVTTLSSDVNRDNAVSLAGTATPNGAVATAMFRYGSTQPAACDDAFGTASDSTEIEADGMETPFTATVTGLKPGTYFFCARLITEAGAVSGDVLSFVIGKETTTTAGGCRCSGDTADGWLLGAVSAILVRLRARRRKEQG